MTHKIPYPKQTRKVTASLYPLFLTAALIFWIPGCATTETPEPSTAQTPQDQTPTLNNLQTETELDLEVASILRRHGIDRQTWDHAEEILQQDPLETTSSKESDLESSEQTSRPLPELPACESPLPWEFQPQSYADSREPATADPQIQTIMNSLPALNDPAMADQEISVNFEQTDIRSVLKTISDVTGMNFIVDDSISGTVTVLSPTRIRLGDLFTFLESILKVKGFAAVPAGNHIKIIPCANISRQNLQIRIGSDPDQIPQNDTILTQFIPLKFANVADVAQILAPRLPEGEQLDIYPPTNTLILTSTSANIHHLAKIIRQIDIPNAREMYTVLPLQYASPEQLSKQITQIMESEKSASRSTRRTAQTPQTAPNIQIQPDTRTNSLIIIASQHDTEIIRGLVERLDIQRPVGTDNIQVVYLKNAPAEEMATALSQALANFQTDNTDSQPTYITPEPGTNALIIHASPQNYPIIASIIQQLDIAREQVLVELRIIEITDDNLREIGIDWATLDDAVADSIRYFGNTNFGIRADAANGMLNGLSVGAFKDIGGELKIGAILNALERVSDVNILSTPQIVTSNHQKARFIVGDNVAFTSKERITETDPSTPTVIREVEYRDVGITLNITPHISQGGLIRLQIESSFTQLVDSVTGLSNDTPTTSKREVETEVSMPDGATIVIGGLIRDDKTTLESKVPLIGDIPWIGELFKFRRDRLQKTNLLMFITPHILSRPEDIAAMTQRKQAELVPGLKEQLKNKTEK